MQINQWANTSLYYITDVVILWNCGKLIVLVWKSRTVAQKHNKKGAETDYLLAVLTVSITTDETWESEAGTSQKHFQKVYVLLIFLCRPWKQATTNLYMQLISVFVMFYPLIETARQDCKKGNFLGSRPDFPPFLMYFLICTNRISFQIQNFPGKVLPKLGCDIILHLYMHASISNMSILHMYFPAKWKQV